MALPGGPWGSDTSSLALITMVTACAKAWLSCSDSLGFQRRGGALAAAVWRPKHRHTVAKLQAGSGINNSNNNNNNRALSPACSHLPLGIPSGTPLRLPAPGLHHPCATSYHHRSWGRPCHSTGTRGKCAPRSHHQLTTAKSPERMN